MKSQLIVSGHRNKFFCDGENVKKLEIEASHQSDFVVCLVSISRHKINTRLT